MRLPWDPAEPKRVILALVYDAAQRAFLLVYNPEWKGYAFSACPWPAVDVSNSVQERAFCEKAALDSLRRDLDLPLPHARALWMERLAVTGVSGRNRRRTEYLYDIVTIDPREKLPAGGFASPFGFLSAQAILAADPAHNPHAPRAVTWTTWKVLGKLLGNQEVGVAVIRRERDGQREYLLTRNREGQLFFPCRRLREHDTPERAIVHEFRYDAHFDGKIVFGAEDAVRLKQETEHLGEREYTFHLRETLFPYVELTWVGNPLEEGLAKSGEGPEWVAESVLRRDPLPEHLSDTIFGVRDAVFALPCEPENAGGDDVGHS